MKETLRRLFLETLEEISLERVMAEKVRFEGSKLQVAGETLDLSACRNIFVAAVGKAASPMAAALVAGLPAERTSGAVVSSATAGAFPPGFKTFAGGHPYPNEQSRAAADFLLERLTALEKQDLVIYLLSGGGSAICEALIDPGIPLDDLRAFYEVLVTCGAGIVDMNVLRKRLSRIKGGRLAAAAHPARQLTLYVSDVPPDQPSTVASGPTMPDESDAALACETVHRLGIAARFPRRIRELFEQGRLPETPKPGDTVFARSSWRCLLDNTAALDVVEAKARGEGWLVERDDSVDDRPLTEAADTLISSLRSLAKKSHGRTAAVTTGGELSSPVTGGGQGGRNQAFVLCAARKIAALRFPTAVISAGTDGIDGNSPAAGALADRTTPARAAALGLDPCDYQRRSDSFRFFERLGDVLITGPTGNNVRDVRMLVASGVR